MTLPQLAAWITTFHNRNHTGIRALLFVSMGICKFYFFKWTNLVGMTRIRRMKRIRHTEKSGNNNLVIFCIALSLHPSYPATVNGINKTENQ